MAARTGLGLRGRLRVGLRGKVERSVSMATETVNRVNRVERDGTYGDGGEGPDSDGDKVDTRSEDERWPRSSRSSSTFLSDEATLSANE